MNIYDMKEIFEKWDGLTTKLTRELKSQVKDEDFATVMYSKLGDVAQDIGYLPVSSKLHSIASDEYRHKTTLSEIVYSLDNRTKRVNVTASGGTTMVPGSIVTWRTFYGEAMDAKKRREALPEGIPFMSTAP